MISSRSRRGPLSLGEGAARGMASDWSAPTPFCSASSDARDGLGNSSIDMREGISSDSLFGTENSKICGVSPGTASVVIGSILLKGRAGWMGNLGTGGTFTCGTIGGIRKFAKSFENSGGIFVDLRLIGIRNGDVVIASSGRSTDAIGCNCRKSGKGGMADKVKLEAKLGREGTRSDLIGFASLFLASSNWRALRSISLPDLASSADASADRDRATRLWFSSFAATYSPDLALRVRASPRCCWGSTGRPRAACDKAVWRSH